MKRYSSKLALTLAAVAIATTGLGFSGSAEADQRYQPRQPAQAPQSVQQEWMHQLKRAQRVNAAGVVFGGPPPRTERRTAGRSIFSPDPFGTRGTVYRQPVEPRRVMRPAEPPRPPQPATFRAAPHRDVAPRHHINPQYLPQRVPYQTSQKAGTIVIDTNQRFLYHVGSDGTAMRYGVGVGKPGFSWRGTHNITQKKRWPSWTPPKAMIAREKKKGRDLPSFMPGGEENPLGARALYLGSTLYRIHGTNQPWTIGQAVSSGCIRMRNEDVKALYERVGVGTKVVVI